jgi:hypothetical protein
MFLTIIRNLLNKLTYRSSIETYINSNNPKDCIDVERLTRQFQYELTQRSFR